jgi:diacylglycerol kinase (ATP)
VKTSNSFLGRIISAFRNSFNGFRHALKHETAFQQELVVFVIMVPVAVMLPVSRVERLILVLMMMLVMAAELINSSIESTVDRISLERHPLAGIAKDLGSAAVVATILMNAVAWIVIAGPVALQWIRG